jgi:hypothetical protein
VSPPLVLLLLALLGLCASLAAAAPFQCGPKPHITTPEPGENNLCQCGREWWWPSSSSSESPALLLRDSIHLTL